MRCGGSFWRKRKAYVGPLSTDSPSNSIEVPGQSEQLAQPSMRVIADSVMVIDFIAIMVLALTAQWLYIIIYLGSNQDVVRYLTVGAAGAFLAVSAIRMQNIYVLETLEVLRGQNARIFFGLVASFMLLHTAAYLLKVSSAYSRGWMTI